MLGLNTGVHAVFLHSLVHLFVGDLVQLSAGDRLRSILDDAQLFGDGNSGVFVVTGDHDRTDAGRATFLDGGFYFGTDRVDHAGQTQKDQILL